jgi:hypothetical protein
MAELDSPKSWHADCDGEGTDGGHMSTEGTYEAALRSLPESHSLALRLTDAGVAHEVICSYLDIEPECLLTFLDLARRKLATALGNLPPEN